MSAVLARIVLVVGLYVGVGGVDAVPQASPASTGAKTVAADAGASAAQGAEPGQPTAPKPVTAVRLATLPKPLPPELTKDINVGNRTKQILAHLSEVIRYYRMTVVPIQKTGEPSDMLYAEQAQSEATQAAQLAFQSARDEAALLSRVEGAQPGPSDPQAEASRLSSSVRAVGVRLTQLQAQDEALQQQIAKAPAKARAALQMQKEDVEGQLELAKASSEALNKVVGISSAQSDSGLEGQINHLQSAAPELVNNKVKPVASTIESIGSMHDAGVSSQAVVLFQLLGTERAIDQRIAETQLLHDQGVDLRTPLIKILRATLAAGQNMQANGPPVSGAPTPGAPAAASSEAVMAARKKMFDQLTEAFRAISDVSIPISQEVLLLEQARANLVSWRAAVDSERTTIVHALLLRVVSISVALGIILGVGEAWRRLTTRYVQDIRRRRQLMLVRRMVIGFLSGLVLIFGFVTQFSSLATFAGFITAGIAVGLQTILLSVAAYFFIVGRYGVRVGDRITVAGVTGDVVEVGLVRFYMMELTGAGTELHPTGRVAVFANSVLFQTGTPLYKQIPGTDYAWHELTLKLKSGTNYLPATEAIQNVITSVYDGYKAAIEDQHRQVESWMDTALEPPHVESRLELVANLQFAVLYPVLIRKAAETDQLIVQKVLEALREPLMAEVIDGAPVVTAVIKG